MRPRKTLKDVLNNGVARQAWVKLKSEIPERDLKSVIYHLEALANFKRPFGCNSIPNRRHVKRLADRLDRPETGLAETIARLNLYYGSELPLGDPEIRKLPEILLRYAKVLKNAARTKKKSRLSHDFAEREIEILRLLDRSEPGKPRHFYEEAAHVIQAAYSVAELKRTVNADQLRKLYDRQSLAHRLRSEAKTSSETEKT